MQSLQQLACTPATPTACSGRGSMRERVCPPLLTPPPLISSGGRGGADTPATLRSSTRTRTRPFCRCICLAPPACAGRAGLQCFRGRLFRRRCQRRRTASGVALALRALPIHPHCDARQPAARGEGRRRASLPAPLRERALGAPCETRAAKRLRSGRPQRLWPA